MFFGRIVQDLNEHEHVQGGTAELVFHLDEMGISDWEDRKTKKVVVSATMRSQTIHCGIFRKVKHISVIVYISAAGEFLIPCIIISQDSVSVREQLKKHRVRFGMERI
jgi:hypothetical protein